MASGVSGASGASGASGGSGASGASGGSGDAEHSSAPADAKGSADPVSVGSSVDAKWKADSGESVRLLQGYFASRAAEEEAEAGNGAAGNGAGTEVSKGRSQKQIAMKAREQQGEQQGEQQKEQEGDAMLKLSYLRWPEGAADHESERHVQKQKPVQVCVLLACRAASMFHWSPYCSCR
jgi:hypothetical protein